MRLENILVAGHTALAVVSEMASCRLPQLEVGTKPELEVVPVAMAWVP